MDVFLRDITGSWTHLMSSKNSLRIETEISNIFTYSRFYPLRPELVESTYLLYRATKNPFYLHVGRDILHSLNNHTRAK